MMEQLTQASQVADLLAGQDYIASTQIATICYLAAKMKRPVLVEGPAGVGKTELAKAVAAATGAELIHLQCYEGLDETKAIYEWEYAKQLLYTQMLKEKIHDLVKDTHSLGEAAEAIIAQENAFFSRHFLLPRPLLKAITLGKPNVLLIDEIDKADPEFEAYLLEVLGNYQITIPELGRMQAEVVPMVFLTSNASRDLSDALKRRCLHLYIDFPTNELEAQIVERKFPLLDKKLVKKMVDAVQAIRVMDLKKLPSISETLDWAQSLVSLQASRLGVEELQTTLGVIAKYEADGKRILEKAKDILGE